MFYEVTLVPCASGFGEYQRADDYGDGWEDIEDLLAHLAAELDANIFALESGEVPKDCDNILGRIHNEPEYVFGWHDGERYRYFGIVSDGAVP